MPRPTSQKRHLKNLAESRKAASLTWLDQNVPPSKSNAQKTSNNHLKTRIEELNKLIASKDEELAQLSEDLSACHAQIRDLTRKLADKDTVIDSLEHEHTALASQLRSTLSKKRKAIDFLDGELKKKRKRIGRLENEREKRKGVYNTELASVTSLIPIKDAKIITLQQKVSDLEAISLNSIQSTSTLHSKLSETQQMLNATRHRLYASQKQVTRLHTSLSSLKKKYKQLSVWNPKKGASYSPAARRLFRDLSWCGVSEDKVRYAIQACARTFGVKICCDVSRRTVGRAIDEGGKFGEIQNAREVYYTPALVESSDGTTHRGITMESRHITMKVPSYEAGTDINDTSTWATKTRFVGVDYALGHTAVEQVDGMEDIIEKHTDIYSRSPLGRRDGVSMDLKHYYKKKVGENKDHASDGKKAFGIAEERKKDFIHRELGRKALDAMDPDEHAEEIVHVSDEDILTEAKMTAEELRTLPITEQTKILNTILERRVGEQVFEKLPISTRELSLLFVFGGCCAHKDMNAFKYGTIAMAEAWKDNDRPGPSLLPNKANASTIRLSDNPDSAALKKAVDSSAGGGIKLNSLMGNLLRHKNGETGYQDRHSLYMQEEKKVLHDLDEKEKFANTSAVRYQSYSYGSAEIICFHSSYSQLIQQTADAKTSSGALNNVEANVLKGLSCPSTMAEVCAMALYGLVVSWPYLSIVRSPGTNLLDLTDLHRKLPVFCETVAKNPSLLLAAAALQDIPHGPTDLTLDGAPFMDRMLLGAVKLLEPELPDLKLMISAMFSGAAKGWIQFTPEFAVGGTFESLSNEARKLLHIPATNDVNEGALGSYRVHMRYHPSSTAHTFSNQTRVERNNTENFILATAQDEDYSFVMREVRKEGASGRRAKFRKAWLESQRNKALTAVRKKIALAKKRQEDAARLADITLELDPDRIKSMTVVQLKDQLKVYKDVLKDKVLVSKKWKDMQRKPEMLQEALAALARELERRANAEPQVPQSDSEPRSNEIETDEVDGVELDEEDWIDMDIE